MTKSSKTQKAVIHCVFCGFDSESAYMVCEGCSFSARVPLCFVPASCGTADCFVQADGEVCFDGESCTHADDFYTFATLIWE